MHPSKLQYFADSKLWLEHDHTEEQENVNRRGGFIELFLGGKTCISGQKIELHITVWNLTKQTKNTLLQFCQTSIYNIK